MKTLKSTLIGIAYGLIPLLLFPFFIQTQETYSLGKLAGTVSIGLFGLSLLPGVLKRFRAKGILQKTQIILMFVRRQLGILTFEFALVHYAWVKILPTITYKLPLSLSLPEFFGLVTLLGFLILTITSNNRSVKLLNTAWKKLHYFVYIAIITLFIHLALREIGVEALFLIGLLVLEISSYLYSYTFSRKNISA